MNGLQNAAGLPPLAALAVEELPRAATCLQDDLADTQITPFPLGTQTVDLRELTKAICEGDEAAFTQFHDLYSLRLYKHLLVLAKGNEAEAREVLQTVVVKLAKKFKVFDEEQRMWGWLCHLTRNAY